MDKRRLSRSGSGSSSGRLGAVLVVLGLLAVGAFAWRVVFASDPSGAAAAPPPGTASQHQQPAPAQRPDGDTADTADTGGTGGTGGTEKNEKGEKPGRSAAAPSRSRAVYLGDSLAMENQDVLAKLVKDSGRATLRSAPHSGTTLCDYLEGRRERSLVPPQHKAAALVREERPQVVVLQFWGNSWGYTPCMGTVGSGTPAYYERYAADARALTEQIASAAREAGIPRPKLVWVLQGPDAMSPDRIRRVNGVYTAQASAAGDLTADAGARVSRAGDRYTYVESLPCTAYERAHPAYCTGGDTTRLHRDDDYLHFCLAATTKNSQPCPVRSPGVLRYCQAIAATVDRHLAAVAAAKES
ncbi:SGNH/GDSL hydrolase family protein [Streptomyces monticola]|uniref:SGNH/GDSL hydrolase family protein n=1 Tax=Streptomyces monticola TaxID=2666263 RepID=A0ABW2JLU4_9ACTN